MDTALLRLFHAAYIYTRRLSHTVITRHPVLDKALGDPLRLFTRRWEWKVTYHALPNPIRIGKNCFFHRSEDAYIISRLSLKVYEPEVNEQIMKLLQPGMTMVDVGANLGWYTCLAAQLIGPSGYVYAFEASPSTVEVLRKNIAVNGNKNIKVTAKGVTDKADKVTFFVEEASGASSLFSSGHEVTRMEVEAISLDEFFQQEGWPPVHLVKIDIEGAEKLALEGMRQLSQRNPQLMLIVEINLKAFSLEELLGALQRCGFSRFRALELGKELSVPQDIPLLLEATRRLTVNLLCQK
jgi:FkbM family methyltransferase